MTRMTGTQFLAEALGAYDVTHLFYVPSVLGGLMPLLHQKGVTTVITHGEKAAAYMADGYARAPDKPGIVLCQDIGTTNLAAGLRDAFMGSSPVIAITGGQDDQPRYRHAYQNAEDFRAWDAVTKANFTVDTVERLPDLLRQAFRAATSGNARPGASGAARQPGADAGARSRFRHGVRGALQAVPGVPARTGRFRHRRGGGAAGESGATDHRRRRRRYVLGRGAGGQADWLALSAKALRPRARGRRWSSWRNASRYPWRPH